MYYDLHIPYPSPDLGLAGKKKKQQGKGKGKATQADEAVPVLPADCWAGLSGSERAEVARQVALSGHLGYTVAAYTVTADQASPVTPCPFGSPEARSLPYPSLDPRYAQQSSEAGPSQPTLVQVTRYHIKLDDGKQHPITAGNTNLLRDYDLLSVYVGSDKALQAACTDLSNPGPNQISIITVPLHERPYHFRLNRKQIKQAQRNGVVFEILYSAGLFPSRSVPADMARKYRQNFLSNARELVRVTGGQNIIFSSGPGGSTEGMRGPLDVVNLATVLGVPANFAKDAVSRTPKEVLLRSQARRTYKAVLSAPRLVPAASEANGAGVDVEMAAGGKTEGKPVKRAGGEATGGAAKKVKA